MIKQNMATPATKTPNTIKVRSRRAKKSAKRIEKEIKKYQEAAGNMVPVTCMRRVIVDAVKEQGRQYRVSFDAQRMLQTEAEQMLVRKFQKANRLAKLSNRDTVTADDLSNVAFFEA